jgi:uncharacterized protein
MAVPRIHLEEAKEESLHFAGEMALPPEATSGESLVALSPVSLSGVISFLDGEFLVDATISYSGSLECSRCLEPFAFSEKYPVRLRLHHRPGFAPKAEAAPSRTPRAPAEEKELSEDDLDLAFYDEPILPFEEIVREQVLIALPMKPLCREDCRGLCPQCGKELNAGACACEHETGDPRLAALKNLR